MRNGAWLRWRPIRPLRCQRCTRLLPTVPTVTSNLPDAWDLRQRRPGRE